MIARTISGGRCVPRSMLRASICWTLRPRTYSMARHWFRPTRGMSTTRTIFGWLSSDMTSASDRNMRMYLSLSRRSASSRLSTAYWGFCPGRCIRARKSSPIPPRSIVARIS